MTVTAFLILLTVCSTITSLIAEAVKKFMDGVNVKYVSNILVLVIAIIVGCGATAIHYVNSEIPFSVLNVVYLSLMGIANWLGAMLGYDKVKQAIVQIKEKSEK